MDRRQFLSLACALGTVRAAGCSGSGPRTGGDPEAPATLDCAWPLPEYDPGKTNYTPETTGLSDPVSELWRVETRDDPSVLAVAAETVFAGGVRSSVPPSQRVGYTSSLSGTRRRP